MKRVGLLLKPGGLLLIEDCGRHSGHETSSGSAQSAFEKMFIGMHIFQGRDPIVGEHLEQLIREAGLFDEIIIQKVELVLSTDQEAIGKKKIPAIRERIP